MNQLIASLGLQDWMNTSIQTAHGETSMTNEEMPDLKRLVSENLRLRRELGIESKAPKALDADGLEKQNEMLGFQLSLLEENRDLLGRPAETLYLLQFLKSIPLPTWSARQNGRIVHWGGTAEKVYKYRSDRAIGRDFVDLFVTEPEKKQARIDLDLIVSGQEGLEHFNLCKDRDRDGRQVYLVTCCFPVFDPRRNEIVQAEVSFDLSQLDALEAELEELHRKHSAEEDEERARRIARERSLIDQLIREAFATLKAHYDRRRDIIERRIEINKERMAPTSKPAERELHRVQLVQNQELLRELNRWEADIKAKIAQADTSERLREVGEEIQRKARGDV